MGGGGGDAEKEVTVLKRFFDSLCSRALKPCSIMPTCAPMRSSRLHFRSHTLPSTTSYYTPPLCHPYTVIPTTLHFDLIFNCCCRFTSFLSFGFGFWFCSRRHLRPTLQPSVQRWRLLCALKTLALKMLSATTNRRLKFGEFHHLSHMHVHVHVSMCVCLCGVSF